MRERLVADMPTEFAQTKMQGRTLVGYASVFDYPIPSGVRGMDQTTYVRRGAFNMTLKEHPEQVQVLLNHGTDPQVGMKPLGVPSVMRQDHHGLYVEVPLDNTSYNEDIIASLSSGALRAMSIQFEVTQEDYSSDRSERNLRQVNLWEFGPVTFPANAAATATLHSLATWAATVPDFGSLEMHWNGAAAMRTCSSAADFRKIAFERNNDSDPDTAAHWTLPHHPRPGAGPDPAGVAAALAALHGGRGGAPDLKMSVASVESHLQRHQTEVSSAEGSRDAAGALREESLIWAQNASHRLELEDEELERFVARMVKLRET